MRKIILAICCTSIAYTVYLQFKISSLESLISNSYKQPQPKNNNTITEILYERSYPTQNNKINEDIKIPNKDETTFVEESPNTNMPLSKNELRSTKSFEEESVDESWAYDFSDKIFNFIHNHNEISNFNVKQIDCRQTMCKVELYINNNDSIIVAQNIIRAFKQEKEWNELPIYFDSEVVDGVIRFEFSRYNH
ncbi:hypothetical protein [Pseudoalteromonas sp.]|uniref:hypothetical protein n=1 Tax=Pseudoalteromonas sp. TaxID=53249 RepID=UPI003565E08F